MIIGCLYLTCVPNNGHIVLPYVCIVLKYNLSTLVLYYGVFNIFVSEIYAVSYIQITTAEITLTCLYI